MSKIKLSKPDLNYLNLGKVLTVHYQLSPSELVEHALANGEGTLASSGALAIDTGTFTGRSPKDRFIVCDEVTEDAVWWGDVNIKFSPEHFQALFEKMTAYLQNKILYVRDAEACAEPAHAIGIRVLTETAYQNLFVHHLLIRPEIDPASNPEWTVLAAPGFLANPKTDGTRQENFSVINFSRKMILIGGTGYTGEIKKGIFSVLNFILPLHKQILSMHCSANVGADGDAAIFFGLSGTGKTTLSADPERALIGDDEHGWAEDSIFNFEGGCYAKCIGLSEEKEPQIYHAIKFGALLENTNYFPGGREVDYLDISKTENTRVAYPLDYIDQAIQPSVAPVPKHIFFLTADAFGVLPPISRLTTDQAMFYFLNGYTAKVAGTETGITEPQLTFSACFGKAFLPLHPSVYAALLGEKLEKHEVNVWLVNTGWSGGAYGTGKRIELKYTRAMIKAALNGGLEQGVFREHPVFKLRMPEEVEGVPAAILDPAKTWTDEKAYYSKARELAEALEQNFRQFEEKKGANLAQVMLRMC